MDMCRNFLLRTSLNAGMWDTAGREAACPPPWHGATSGSVGRSGQWKLWPHEFLGCDFPGKLNKVSPSFRMRTDLVIAFLQVRNVQM